MKLGKVFDVMLDTWKVRLQCIQSDLDFIAFSNDPVFEPYLNCEIQYVFKGRWTQGSCNYEINIFIK